MTLTEGGNIWPEETTDFDQRIIPELMKQINSVVSKTGAEALPMGSGASPTPGKRSGDLDMIIDSGALKEYFGVKDDKNARIELEKLFQQSGFDTKRTGTSVHVKLNQGDEAHQVDIMVVPDGHKAQKFHVHDIPSGSPYKGIHKHIALAALAKQNDLKWSPYKGLVDRETNKILSSDLDEIAQKLLGDDASGRDLASVERIVKALGDQGKEFLSNLESDPDSIFVKKKIKNESMADRDLNRIRELTARMFDR